MTSWSFDLESFLVSLWELLFLSGFFEEFLVEILDFLFSIDRDRSMLWLLFRLWCKSCCLENMGPTLLEAKEIG